MNKLTPAENTLLGVVAGTEVLLVVQPMIFWKNAAQQGLAFSANPRRVYRGLGVSASSQGLVSGVQFLSTGTIKRALTGGVERRLSGAETVGAALAGGCVSGLVCAPTELLMIQQQRQGGGLPQTAARLLREHGVGSLRRGLGPTVVREGVYCCGYLGIAPTMSRLCEEAATGRRQRGGEESSGGAAARVAGALCGGIFAGVASHPFDTVKTCLQGDVGGAGQGAGGALAIARQLGWAGLYRGVAWRSAVIVSATLLINIFKDASAPLMFPTKFE